MALVEVEVWWRLENDFLGWAWLLLLLAVWHIGSLVWGSGEFAFFALAR